MFRTSWSCCILPLLLWLLGTGTTLILPHRLYAQTGTATPLPPVAQELMSDGIQVAGQYVVLYTEASEKPRALRLVALGDRVVTFYAHTLLEHLPSSPLLVYMFPATEAYQRAADRFNAGRTRDYVGFANNSTVYMRLQTSLNSSEINEEDLKWLLAHELCHALHQRLYLSYNNLPEWLMEGVAEAWAEQALSAEHNILQEPTIEASTKILIARHAQEAEQLPPLLQLLNAKFFEPNTQVRDQRYSQAFTLIRLLEDAAPDNATRRRQFRAFLHEVNSPTPPLPPAQINAHFVDLFGGPDMVSLQQEYTRYLATCAVSPWEKVGGEVRSGKEGEIDIDAPAKTFALALSTKATNGSAAILHTEAIFQEGGSPEAALAFGRTQPNDGYLLGFGRGYVLLMHYTGTTQTLATMALAPNLLSPGRHILEARVTAHRVQAWLDGRYVLDAMLPAETFSSGQWGVACMDGHMVFRNTHATMIRE